MTDSLHRYCPVCGFQQDDSSESGRCLGCGYQLDPHPEHDVPPPGQQVRPQDEDYYVTSADVAQWPTLYGVLLIEATRYEYGRGIGAEPYGYFITFKKWLIDLDMFTSHESHEYHAVTRWFRDEDTDPVCPKCDRNVARYIFSQDRCAEAGGDRLECMTCDHVYFDEVWV